MIQFHTEKIRIGEIPVQIVHPIREDKRAVAVFYHGWSSSGSGQMTRALILAAHGYTVFLPDAVNHGERGKLSDYYSAEVYALFWETIFRNEAEFPCLSAYFHDAGWGRPWVLGHSMGGMTVLGLAAKYPEALRGAVSFNGSGDWLLTNLFIQARFGVPMEREWPLYDVIAEETPMAHLDAVKKVPIFMTNGEVDLSIDPRAQARFAEALAAHGGQGVRVTYPGLAHFVTTNMMDDTIAWMQRGAAEV